MAIKDFSEYLYSYELAENDRVKLGQFKIVEDGDLAYIRPLFVIHGHGHLTGTESIKIEVYNDAAYTSLYDESEYMFLSNVTFEATKGPSYIGWLSFPLNNKPVQANDYIYPLLDIGGYTPDSGTFSIDLIYDFPIMLYGSSRTKFYQCPFTAQIFLKQAGQ